VQKCYHSVVCYSIQIFFTLIGLCCRFSCGNSGYQTLIDQKYPLPSLRTLRSRIQGVKFESGILDEVFKFLRLKASTMDPKERKCSLSMDEMVIKKSRDYDQRSDSIMGKPSNAQLLINVIHCFF
jgi:hypothetical protein